MVASKKVRGSRVPARMEGRVERQAVMGDGDRCDFHRYAAQMVLRSVYLSIAWGERSRPKPDCLKPPNGRREVRAVEAVEPDRAGLEGAGHAVRGVDVARPHRRAKAVDRVVGEADRLLLGLDGGDGEHRPEDFLARDAASPDRRRRGWSPRHSGPRILHRPAAARGDRAPLPSRRCRDRQSTAPYGPSRSGRPSARPGRAGGRAVSRDARRRRSCRPARP